MLLDSKMRLIENDNSTGEQMGFDECRKLCQSILKIVKMRLINVEVHFLQLKHKAQLIPQKNNINNTAISSQSNVTPVVQV